MTAASEQEVFDAFGVDTIDKAPHAEWAKAECVVGVNGGTLSTGVLTEPLELAGDWTGVLKGFGLDPDVFEVVDDTVTMSKWQQSKRLEDGDRDTIWLWSYKARFNRKAAGLAATDLTEITEFIRTLVPKPIFYPGKTKGPECTFLVNLADIQLAKSAGGGVKATVLRVMAALESAVLYRQELSRSGMNIVSTMLANLGDPIEGCAENYASQLHTVELNLREQLKLAIELFIKAIDILGVDKFLSVLSNHSEWMRRNGKSVTGDSDSADGHIADMLKLAYEMVGGGPDEWHIPHDEMVTMANLSGVNVAFTHGHKIPSAAKEELWLKGHSIHLLREYGEEPRIWVTAHKHHYEAKDFGPWFRFQCPSLDGGSKWYTDMSGNWATPGLLVMLVGNHDPRGFSHQSLL